MDTKRRRYAHVGARLVCHRASGRIGATADDCVRFEVLESGGKRGRRGEVRRDYRTRKQG